MKKNKKGPYYETPCRWQHTVCMKQILNNYSQDALSACCVVDDYHNIFTQPVHCTDILNPSYCMHAMK